MVNLCTVLQDGKKEMNWKQMWNDIKGVFWFCIGALSGIAYIKYISTCYGHACILIYNWALW